MVEALLGVQIIAIFFGAFMLYVAFIHLKSGNLDPREFLFWLILWAAFIFFALFPRVLDPILANLFVTRALDLVMIVAFMILSYLGFQNHVGIKAMQKQMESLIREKAIKNVKEK